MVVEFAQFSLRKTLSQNILNLFERKVSEHVDQRSSEFRLSCVRICAEREQSVNIFPIDEQMRIPQCEFSDLSIRVGLSFQPFAVRNSALHHEARIKSV
jgi:hypothetical protein